MVEEVSTKETESNEQPKTNSNTNGLAIASMVLGIASLVMGWAVFLGFATGIVAVVLGIIALKKKTGKGMSITGIVTGAISVIWGLVLIYIVVAGISLFGGAVSQWGLASNEINKALNSYNQEQKALIESQKDFSKGTTAKFGNFEIKINNVTRNYVPSDGYYWVDDSKELVAINITVKNVGNETEYFGTSDLKINVNGILEYPSYSYNLSPKFEGGDMTKGASVTGNIVFEVTKDAPGLKLQHEETVYSTASSEFQTLTFTLEI